MPAENDPAFWELKINDVPSQVHKSVPLAPHLSGLSVTGRTWDHEFRFEGDRSQAGP